MQARPAYSDLPGGNARGVFGDKDVFGCLNLLTPERVKSASGLIKTGHVFSLNGSILDWPNPNPFGGGTRPKAKHVMLKFGEVARDDYLDGFYPQCGSQWDHFFHLGDLRNNCFYNGLKEGETGMGDWAERGIVGRGVLLDLAAWREAQRRPIDWRTADITTAADLEACARSQGVTVTEGTILLLRFGWETGYRPLTLDERTAVAENQPLSTPGLEPSTAVAERLWDWGVAAVAADNPGMEVFPINMDKPLLHELVMAHLGIPLGEFWLLDALAKQCHAEKRYEFFLTSAPLNVPAGVGSTANVLAIL
jgi:hypothetical protein